MFLDSGLYLNMRIALDVMGGDNAPQAIMAGAVEALEAFGGDLQKLFLVGDETAIKEELKHLSYAHGKIEIVHASEVVTMHDSAVKSVRQKKDSSISVAVDLVKRGEHAVPWVGVSERRSRPDQPSRR